MIEIYSSKGIQCFRFAIQRVTLNSCMIAKRAKIKRQLDETAATKAVCDMGVQGDKVTSTAGYCCLAAYALQRRRPAAVPRAPVLLTTGAVGQRSRGFVGSKEIVKPGPLNFIAEHAAGVSVLAATTV